jgi:O-antigen/teichoic acid export membrane protein
MIGKAVFGFFQLAILARLLSPQDFGLMALVMAIITFAQVFADMGVSSAIIHYQQISLEELSSLFWLNVLCGTGLMILMMLASPFFSWVYHEPQIQPILICVSVVFIIVPIGQQLQVIAEKKLNFTSLARLELASAITGFLAAVGVALIGGGVYALVAGMLVSAAVTTGLAWFFFAEGWRPMLRLRVSEIRRFLGFGGYMVGNNLVNSLNMQADIFFGGRTLGANMLGTYSLPRDLCLKFAFIINPIITRVGFPVMAKVQGDRALLKEIYLNTIRMTASVNFPIYLGLLIFAPEVVRLLFGSQWLESIPLLRILAFWGLVRSTGNPVGSLLYAKGRADLSFKWNVVMLFVFFSALWFGSRYGGQGIAISLLASHACAMIPLWYFLVRPLSSASFREYFRQMLVPFTVAVISVIIGFVVAKLFKDTLFRLTTGVTVGGLAYLVLSRYLNRSWYVTIKELFFRR